MKSKALLALLLVSCTLLPALAQTTPAPSQQKPATETQSPSPKKPADDQDDVVKITTNLVQVDAVVTKDGKHVTDLTADDFEIYEDGKKKPITSFAYISNVRTTTAPSSVKPEKKTDVVPFTPINPNDPHRTIAIVVDDFGLSAESMGRIRGQLRKFIAEQAQPNDLIAIIRTGGEVGALQQFTNDKRILGRAVDMLRWNPCSRAGIHVIPSVGGGSSIPYCGYRTYNQTLKALRFIIDSMGQLPGRKSMVLLSDSLPRESQDELTRVQDMLKSEGIVEEGPSPFGDTINYQGFLQNIVEKAIRASVVIYSVDTQGLPTVDLTAADVIHGNYRQFDQQVAAIRSSRMSVLTSRREGGNLMAKETGGFQVRNSNSLELNRIVEDQSGYYLIGYRPSEETFDRRFHKIRARVKRGGMNLRTRFGFFGVTEEEAKRVQPTPREVTNLALASPFRAQDIEVDMTSFFADEPQAGSMVRSFIYIDVNGLDFDLIDGEHQSSIEIHGVIFGDNGSIVEQLKTGGKINLTDSELAYAKANGFGMGINMPVKKQGSYQVRLVIRDRKSARIGSAAQFVQVPNLKDKKLAVSGIVLATLDQASSQRTAEQTILNPGSRRFATQTPLYFAYRLYNATLAGGSQLRNVVAQAKIFRDGKDVYTGDEVPVDAGSQKDLNRLYLDGSVKLGAELEPGNYYLQIVITDKGMKKENQVVQWADFEIVK